MVHRHISHDHQLNHNQVRLRLSDEDFDRVTALARKSGLPKAEIARILVRTALEDFPDL
ncbi:MAG: ribbon-helix-helix protein, CopG family [Marivivens sp.]|nr:ribbon-helix-helix protein, CopG family [Marivivens sp.]NCW68736.1 ribbon-helix-helix protein, CopG family [Marivivens sp.]